MISKWRDYCGKGIYADVGLVKYLVVLKVLSSVAEGKFLLTWPFHHFIMIPEFVITIPEFLQVVGRYRNPKLTFWIPDLGPDALTIFVFLAKMLNQLLLAKCYSLADDISWSNFLNQFNLQERYLVNFRW